MANGIVKISPLLHVIILSSGKTLAKLLFTVFIVDGGEEKKSVVGHKRKHYYNAEDVLAKESEIYAAQARESGKPDEIVEKMISGRLRKFVSEVSLLEQQFVKDPESKIRDLLAEVGADIVQFVRYEVGEGIEKEEEDFAAEVAAQLNS